MDNSGSAQQEPKRIYTDFSHSVARRDWYPVIERLHDEIYNYAEQVHVVHDFRNVEYRMMTTSLKHAVTLALNIPPNAITYTVLTDSYLIEFVGKIVYRLVPNSSKKIHFAKTMEAVEHIIATSKPD